MHPCCNCSLQTGTKIIAIVQLVGAILLIIYGILGLTAGGVLTSKALNENNMHSENLDDSAATHAAIGFVVIVASVFLLVAGIVSLLTSIVLFIGANKRNRTMCMIWFVLTAISLIVCLLSTLKGFVSGEHASRPAGWIFGMLLQSYFMWVVWAFMTELKEEAASSPYGNTKPF